MEFGRLKYFLVILLASCLSLQSCGGSGDEITQQDAQQELAGMFEGPVADMTANPPTSDAIIGVLGVVSATKIMGTNYISASDVIDAATNSISVIKNAVQPAEGICIGQGDMKKKCYVKWETIEANSDFEFSEWGRQMGKGHAQIYVRFWNSSYNDKCGRSIGIMGMGQCSLDFDISNESSNPHSIINGLCNTDADHDKLLDVEINGVSYQIGFDLYVDYNNESKNIEGVVSINGTNYQLKDLRGSLTDRCK